MKRILILLLAVTLIIGLCGCKETVHRPSVAATTAPVYEFASFLCQGTDIAVTRLITENVSCLHDYTLQVSQMKAMEYADLVILSGAGLEEFMDDVLVGKHIIDASSGIETICSDHDHAHDHHHETDPHVWLAPKNAKIMANNICRSLCEQYPQYTEIITENLQQLNDRFDALQTYAEQALASLSSRQLLTFHDGFAYLAQAFDLEILHAIEEESGREASAAELIGLCKLVQENSLAAIFTEQYGSTSAASIISAETGAKIFQLDMAMGDCGYFDAMYHNIDTLKEALE